ncbi:hypothetical protein GGX14DRAFT_663933 [Mycena pura]|uniref:RNA polymerase II degradation factor 1 n=1 Tax=Mycena pura TaxID=153505 RepID=A0AAD6YLC3_9AGAR|nr:hypothetical protein GGX14DRAFT_663933 [Mycena pura]
MSYKTAIGAPSPAASPDNSKYRAQARQLQELFPTWSNDDLQSLLQEVAGDVELAAARISEGHAEQWGAVTRKKDKKAHAPAHASKDSVSSTRGDFRGGRGGARGGRGGSTRGGVASRSRGSVRGAAPVNGHAHTHHTSTAPAQSSSSNAWADRQTGTDKTSDSSVAWSSDPPIPALPSNWSETVETPTPSATPSSWAGTSTTSTWVGDNDVNGSATSSPVVSPPKVSKTPATSKMSWAQIARPQEKPASIPVPAAIVPLPNITHSPPEPEPQQVGWEEPTTEAPVFKPSTSAADVWASTTINEPPEEPKSDPQQIPEQQVAEEPVLEPAAQPVVPPPEPEVVPLAASPSPSIKPTRPATSSHRNSARYKNIDQAVVMPSSFSSGLEKVGMQFGSLSLGGDSTLDNAYVLVRSSEPEPASEPKSASPTPAPVLHDTPPTATQGLPQQASPQPPSQHPITSSISQPVVSQTPKVALAEALASQSNPITPAMQQELNQLTSQQQQQYLQQHGGYIPPHLQQQLQLQQQQQQHQHLPQQSHTQHQYSQHGLPTHIDPSQPQATPQHQASSAHSSYFRNEPTPATSSPYFHAPTPPAGQTQDTPYGAFGQLGGQGQHQQGGHLSGFTQDYSHAADIQRGFYDTYQSSAFGNRNVLGHEDAKGLAGAPQQPPNAGGLPSSGQSVGQHGGAQGAGQQQPPPAAGPQGQQGYPPPLPYYYPYPQNQYYGAPYNSAYNVAPPFVKYPTMFPGPPGPGNGPATGQQGQGSLGVKSQGQAQGQAGAYGPAQGLYQGGYDDYAGQTQGHGTHQQPQHALGLGQGGVDYGKQLYGGGAQGFMGLSGQGGGAGGPQAANARGGSPETSYKPYAKDVGVSAARGGAGVQQGQGQGQQQSQGQVQSGPQGQGFYGGNRFGGAGVGGVSAGGAGPQQSAHHQQGVPQGHLGYSQAQNDFYPYQGRQQQYW